MWENEGIIDWSWGTEAGTGCEVDKGSLKILGGHVKYELPPSHSGGDDKEAVVWGSGQKFGTRDLI